MLCIDDPDRSALVAWLQQRQRRLLRLLSLLGCSNGSDGYSEITEKNVHGALDSFRVQDSGVYDHYVEFEKFLTDGVLGSDITLYQVETDSSRTSVWQTALTETQAKSIHLTGALVNGNSVYFTGYFSLSMDGFMANLEVNSLTNGFLLQLDKEKGWIIAATAVQAQNGVSTSVVIPQSIVLRDGILVVTGRTTGGILIGRTSVPPESALDEFRIAIDPVTRTVLSASLSPISSAQALSLRNDAIAAKDKSFRAPAGTINDGTGSVVLDFFGNFEATAVTQWAQSNIWLF